MRAETWQPVFSNSSNKATSLSNCSPKQPQRDGKRTRLLSANDRKASARRRETTGPAGMLHRDHRRLRWMFRPSSLSGSANEWKFVMANGNLLVGEAYRRG